RLCRLSHSDAISSAGDPFVAAGRVKLKTGVHRLIPFRSTTIWKIAGLGLAILLAGFTFLSGVTQAQGESIASGAAPEPFPERERVADLIAQLGKSQYVVRRTAEQELLAIGMPAVDQIDEAASSIDPEIAANCRYLLSQLTVRWTR